MADEEEEISFEFHINYKTNFGEEIYILGNSPDFGNWKECKFKLKWSEGNIWKGNYTMKKSAPDILYKFVNYFKDHDSKKWEIRPNRLLSANNTKHLQKNDDGVYILECLWDCFTLNFNIHYDISSKDSFMMIIGSSSTLGNWNNKNKFDERKMEYDNEKIIEIDENTKIKGFWTKNFYVYVGTEKLEQIKNELVFEYRYLIYDNSNNTAIWEREPNRRINILFDLNDDENKFYYLTNPTEYKLLSNSFCEILDLNFVEDLKIDKIGDKNIYIGDCPQTLNDINELKNRNINAILNLQSENEINSRQINKELINNEAEKNSIEIVNFPIDEFSNEDLINKLKEAGDKLRELVKEGDIVFVHCGDGMNRSACTIIIYLILYEKFTLEQARDYVKQYHNVICPNYKALNAVVEKYAKGKEMKNEIL